MGTAYLQQSLYGLPTIATSDTTTTTAAAASTTSA